VFYCAIYTDVGMTLNLNPLMVSAPPCTNDGIVSGNRHKPARLIRYLPTMHIYSLVSFEANVFKLNPEANKSVKIYTMSRLSNK
jgi:hypothetical protein